MSDPVIAVFMLGLFIFMVMLGFPIAFTLIAMGLGFGYYAYYDAERMQTIFDNRIFDLFVQNTFSCPTTYWWPSHSSYSWAMWSNGPT
jgi:TRAP-type mannitol/chloroaromatic compound transport system permease large subunit